MVCVEVLTDFYAVNRCLLLTDGLDGLPEPQSMRVENKMFYFDVGQNRRGVFMRVSEVLSLIFLHLSFVVICCPSAEEFHDCGHYKAEEATVIWPYVSYARQETDKSNHAGHGGWGPT